MNITVRMKHFICIICFFSCAVALKAQTPEPQVRMIDVEGRKMQIISAGLDKRAKDAPVVILEAGNGTSSETWGTFLSRVAEIAPVVAYDRRGLGKSEPDPAKPALDYSPRVLQKLLANAGIAPPYILVGHSWGGPLIRMYAGLFPNEVAGLVFLDPSSWGTKLEQRLAIMREAGASEDEINELTATKPLNLPANTSPGARAEVEYYLEVQRSGDVSRILAAQPPLPEVPVSVLLSARKPKPTPVTPGRADRNQVANALRRLHFAHQVEMALNSPNGLVFISTGVGHYVFRDDPDLALQAIRHTLSKYRPGK